MTTILFDEKKEVKYKSNKGFFEGMLKGHG